ncbi:hypothetical protein ACQKNX_04810 [Lysinibacillus sp. NPDC093712]|uniref:hypothetical protein n=1 Tax=Lysinibacillus sp. NPDC093712 TaxID=3390579 RepID=UPI003CFF3FF5
MNIQGVASVETKTIKSLMIQLEPQFTNGHDFCELIVDETANRFTAILYGGESYTHCWGAPGDSFIKFLIDIFGHKDEYLYEKLADYSKEKFIDTEKVGEHLKRLLLTARRQLIIDKYDTEEMWDKIEQLQSENEMTEEHLYGLWNSWFDAMIKHDIVSNEPWFEDFIERQKDWKCLVFCQKVAPILAEVLKVEYELVGVNEG